MGLSEDLSKGVDSILSTKWDVRKGTKVPNTEDVKLAGGGVELEATVLYADLAQSSKLATDFQRRTAAKVIKSFLFCCTKLITVHDGIVTSFDGDRVMGVYVGNTKNTNAGNTALKIKYAVTKIIRPKLQDYFKSMQSSSFKIDHAVGIDTSDVVTVRAGQRGSNDLVWIGRSPNFAAKLSEIREGNYNSFASSYVYNRFNKSVKKSSGEGKSMWEKYTYKWIGETWTIYRSSWWRSP